MAARHTGWAKKSGDVGASSDLDTLGRKLLGYLTNQQALGGPPGMTIRRDTPQGTVVASTFGGMPQYVVYAKDEVSTEMEEVVYLYASSATKGLQVFDLGQKRLVRAITGLEPYALQRLSRDHRTAWLTSGAGTRGTAVRLDFEALSATAKFYQVNTPDGASIIAGTAIQLDSADTSPDDSRIVMHFHGSGVVVGSSVSSREGVGGHLLVDAETLDPIRPALRMSFQPAPCVWREDGERFYLATSVADDLGDAPTEARLQALTESQTDYISVFNKDGTHLGSTPVAAWTDVPSSAFTRAVTAMEAHGDRLYVFLDNRFITGASTHALMILDISSDLMPQVNLVDLSALNIELVQSVCLSRGGDRMVAATGEGMAQFGIEADEVTVEYNQEKAEYLAQSTGRDGSYYLLQLGPDSRVGNRPDTRQFFINDAAGTTVLRAYRDLASNDDPVYEFDMTPFEINYHYRLANVGARPKRKAA